MATDPLDEALKRRAAAAAARDAEEAEERQRNFDKEVKIKQNANRWTNEIVPAIREAANRIRNKLQNSGIGLNDARVTSGGSNLGIMEFNLIEAGRLLGVVGVSFTSGGLLEFCGHNRPPIDVSAVTSNAEEFFYGIFSQDLAMILNSQPNGLVSDRD